MLLQIAVGLMQSAPSRHWSVLHHTGLYEDCMSTSSSSQNTKGESLSKRHGLSNAQGILRLEKVLITSADLCASNVPLLQSSLSSALRPSNPYLSLPLAARNATGPQVSPCCRERTAEKISQGVATKPAANSPPLIRARNLLKTRSSSRSWSRPPTNKSNITGRTLLCRHQWSTPSGRPAGPLKRKRKAN